MIRPQTLSLTGLAIGLAWTTGCQNTFRVRVERVLVEPSVKLAHNSWLGRELDAAANSLTDLINNCAATERVMDGIVASFPQGQQEAVEGALFRDWRELLCRTVSEAQDYRKQCADCFEFPDITKRKVDAWATIRGVQRFFERRRPILADWRKKGLADFENEKAALSVRTADSPSESRLARSGNELSASAMFIERSASPSVLRDRSKFGGFVNTDVYSINPSDPKYKKILGTSSPWAWLVWGLIERDLSVQTLTDTTVGVTGDSSIMVVMEHPGQFRVYQVSNDPAQITSNIALLISKATAAASKFMSAGVF